MEYYLEQSGQNSVILRSAAGKSRQYQIRHGIENRLVTAALEGDKVLPRDPADMKLTELILSVYQRMEGRTSKKPHNA